MVSLQPRVLSVTLSVERRGAINPVLHQLSDFAHWGTKIIQAPYSSVKKIMLNPYLVGGAITILKNMSESQWEG